MSRLKIIGLSITLLGVAMLLLGASIFTYRGSSLNPIISDLGKYPFFLLVAYFNYRHWSLIMASKTKIIPRPILYIVPNKLCKMSNY